MERRSLPADPSPQTANEDPGDQVADLGKDRGVDLILREHLERAVDPAKVGGEPHEDSGKQDDGTGLLMNDQPRSHMLRSTLPRVGQW